MNEEINLHVSRWKRKGGGGKKSRPRKKKRPASGKPSKAEETEEG